MHQRSQLFLQNGPAVGYTRPAPTKSLELDTTIGFHSPYEGIAIWLHWMAPLVMLAIYLAFPMVFQPADIATVRGSTRRNATCFLLPLTMLTFVSNPFKITLTTQGINAVYYNTDSLPLHVLVI